MAPVKKLLGVDDFGVIRRGQNDVEICGLGGAFQHAEKCRIIDDAIVYLKNTSATEVVALMDQAANSSPYFPNTPPGRLPDFYRVIVASRLFYQKTLQAPTLFQLLAVLDLIEDARGRDDDYAMLETAVRAVLKYKLTPAERAWAEERLNALELAAKDTLPPGPAAVDTGAPSTGGPGLTVIGPGPIKPLRPVLRSGGTTDTAGGPSLATALALGTGGFFVGGPIGAAVGAVVGLVVGSKK